MSAATGMALMGLRPVIEMQFADFITTAFDSIVQFAATTHYRWGGAVPWVIQRRPTAAFDPVPFTLRTPRPGLCTRRAQGGGARDARRRQRTAHRGDPRQQPGHLP